MPSMKKLSVSLSLLAALVFSATSVQAAFIINFDESGKGQVIPAPIVGIGIPLPSLGNQVDPVDPGNGLKPLVYDLVSTTGIAPTPGDILLLEPSTAQGALSDLLRFTPNGLLEVYSDLEAGVPNPGLADVGLPATGVLQKNTLVMPEFGPEIGPNGLFGYVPTPGQPGSLPVPPGAAVYNFVSDPAVPEPDSMSLLILGGSALLIRPRR